PTKTSDDVGRRAAGSGITNSGSRRPGCLLVSPISIVGGDTMQETTVIDHDSVLLRHKADSGRTRPGGNAGGHSNPQTHSPHCRRREADRSPRLSPDW